MPLPPRVEGGYKGVNITQTKLGFCVVHMSHNKHRFGTLEEAREFVDGVIERERPVYTDIPYWVFAQPKNTKRN